MPVIKRTEYRNNGLPDNPRTGDTGHGESMVDFENYLLPVEGLRTAALHGWGVAGGLTVSAVSGTSVVTVLPGIALDAGGRAIMLVPDGAAVVEQPPAPPNDVPTVTVTAAGVELDTTGLSGDVLVTVTWLEAGVYSQPSAPQLVHAPWLQLLPAAGFADTGEQVVLARVTLDQAGEVMALTAGPRRTVDLPVAGIRLRRPASAGVPAPAGGGGQPATAVTDPTVAALTTRPDGGVQLTVGLPAASAPVLTVAGSGAVSLPGATSVSGTLSVSGAATLTGAITAGADLTVAGTASVTGALSVAGAASVTGAASVIGALSAGDDMTVARDLTVDGAASVAGTLAVQGGASLTAGLAVTGSTALTGPTTVTGATALNGDVAVGSGLAIAGPLTVAAATDLAGSLVARGDVEVAGRVTSTATGDGGALDVRHRMRVRQGGDVSAGIWLHQDGPDADRAFVGMLDDARVGFFGVGCGWGVTMDVGSAAVSMSGALSVTGGARVSGDAVVGAGGDGAVKVRHVVGKSWQNDSDDDLYLNWSTGRAVHVGGGQRAALYVSADAVVGAGGDGAVKVRHVRGKSWQNDSDDDLYLNWDNGRNVHVGGGQGANLVVAGGANSARNVVFPPWSGGGVGTWDIFARGAVYVGNDPNQPRIAMYNDGTIKASTISVSNKFFVIDHPLDPEHRSLRHASLEGPESGVHYRGEARLTDGRARVVLPDYFEALTRAERRTVLLTPVIEDGGPAGVLGATPVADGCFDVVGGAGCAADQAFCWQVTAVRADVDEFEVEVAKSAAGRTAPVGAAR